MDTQTLTPELAMANLRKAVEDIQRVIDGADLEGAPAADPFEHVQPRYKGRRYPMDRYFRCLACGAFFEIGTTHVCQSEEVAE